MARKAYFDIENSDVCGDDINKIDTNVPIFVFVER